MDQGNKGAGAGSGGQEAFDRLFGEKSIHEVEGWLERLGVPAHSRSDIARHVLSTARASFPSFDPERTEPERWLHRITIHIASHFL